MFVCLSACAKLRHCFTVPLKYNGSYLKFAGPIRQASLVLDDEKVVDNNDTSVMVSPYCHAS